jgi:hypothetical protein
MARGDVAMLGLTRLARAAWEGAVEGFNVEASRTLQVSRTARHADPDIVDAHRRAHPWHYTAQVVTAHMTRDGRIIADMDIEKGDFVWVTCDA